MGSEMSVEMELYRAPSVARASGEIYRVKHMSLIGCQLDQSNENSEDVNYFIQERERVHNVNEANKSNSSNSPILHIVLPCCIARVKISCIEYTVFSP